MKLQTIQSGLLLNNTSSCLMYLSDYYNITTIVYLYNSNKYIETSCKNRDKFRILYKNQKWYQCDELHNYEQTEFNKLSSCLQMDISTNDIYVKYLKGISNYKLDDLIKLAKEFNISLITDTGKKKTKKILYDDINLYKFI